MAKDQKPRKKALGARQARTTSSAPLLQAPGAHAKAVTALAFAPDGRTLVSGGDDAAIRLWEISSK